MAKEFLGIVVAGPPRITRSVCCETLLVAAVVCAWRQVLLSAANLIPAPVLRACFQFLMQINDIRLVMRDHHHALCH
jgi:hypothetical protein